MKRLLICALVAAVIGGCGQGTGPPPESSTPAGRPPKIRPDYAGAVIPPNIAPLNFVVEEPGRAYCVEVGSDAGPGVVVHSDSPAVSIPLRPWRRLLAANRGGRVRFVVYARQNDGRWLRFEPFEEAIAREPIDPVVVYRRIGSGYNVFRTMGIYQRDLEGFGESPMLENRSTGRGCINCHTFLNNAPDALSIQFRSSLQANYGAGMLLIRNGRVQKVDTRSRHFPGRIAGFTAWHPGGRIIAFSANTIRQFFLCARPEVRECTDLNSDLGLYLIESNSVVTTPAISRPDRLETWPTWSPDGRYLYYCSAAMPWSDTKHTPPERYDEVRYDLMRISYDLKSGRWGEPETVLCAAETGGSITIPRISPDGRFLVFCMCDYGHFAVFHPETDLYLMDLATGAYRKMECNSDQCDSWHCWSSNGRWLAFGSKRDDGVFSRVYFTYVDSEGRAHKPFIMPQKDPTYYDSCIQSLQLPVLITGRVRLTGERVGRVVRKGPWVSSGLPLTGATPTSAEARQRRE